jgi:glycosyltransferase involved in cell wall biosynthesis/CDP-glycerol glycerophosphotransferase (TagB/SpsB family)
MSTTRTQPDQASGRLRHRPSAIVRRRTGRPDPAVHAADGEGRRSGGPGSVALSLVIPMYRVEQYLPELLDSLSAQVPGRYTLQCVFIDDGSPDRSAELVERWIDEGRPAAVEAILIRQDNAGVSAARNRGIGAVSGQWIAFPDSDDSLDRRYCTEVAEFLLGPRGDAATIVATNLIKYVEAEGRLVDNHTLRFKFRGRARTVPLTTSPHYLQMHASSTFFRRSDIEQHGIRFIEGLHASEDALFVAEVLATRPDPMLGVVPGAIFRYRKRASGDSAVDLYHTKTSTYFERFDHGYLPLLARLAAERGKVPEWFANQVLYELKWLFVAEHKVSTKALLLSPEQRRAFLDRIRAVLSYIDDSIILGFYVTPMAMEIRYLLLALKGSPLPDPQVHLMELDARRHMVQVRYLFTGDLPDEEYTVRGQVVAPLHAKIRTLDYFGQTVLRERRVWLPATNWVAVWLDGRRQELRLGPLQSHPIAFNEKQIWQFFERPLPARLGRREGADVPGSPVVRRVQSLRPHAGRAKRALLTEGRRWARRLRPASVKRHTQKLLALSPAVALRYRNAWVLMDRVTAAQDNAEHLYRHIKENHPDTNIWFVLDRASADWQRLRAEGFRLVQYRSGRHHRMMRHARHLISSHIDVEVVNAVPKERGRFGRWSYTFLQHGVTKEDISIWMNDKDISRFITATRPEYDSIAGDDTSYLVTSKEVELSGFPRFDRLRRLGDSAEKRVLLVAPTWRETLMAPKVAFQKTRALKADFASSEYSTNWFGLLRDPAFAQLAAESGLEIVLLPHPMLARAIEPSELPEWVTLRQYGECDAQALLAGARVMITDYSSTAFDVAYAGGDVVYFQFDRDAALNGAHRAPGYFDYERDGFGPVGLDRAGVLDGLRTVLGDGREAYADRASVFAHHDDGNCERVYRSIVELDLPAVAP